MMKATFPLRLNKIPDIYSTTDDILNSVKEPDLGSNRVRNGNIQTQTMYLLEKLLKQLRERVLLRNT